MKLRYVGHNIVLSKPSLSVWMVSVSENMKYFKINKDIINNSDYWNKLVNSVRSSLLSEPTLENKVLVIKLQDVINDDVSMIPKLEFHKENSWPNNPSCYNKTIYEAEYHSWWNYGG